MLKVGVIGAGSMGRHHVRVYSELENCQLIGLADPNPERGQLATQYGAKFYSDYRELLAQSPDLITIAAPTSQHYEIGSEAIEAGCHLLMEKPITDSLESAAELIKKAKRAERMIAVGHIERFNPAVTALKQLIDRGELGEILAVNALRVGPYHGRILDTGIILDLGTHDVDLTSYLLSARATTVFATAIQRQHNHEDHAVLHLQFPEGKAAVIETSWLAPYRSRSVFVFASKHFALCDLINQQVHVFDENPEGGRLLSRQPDVERGEPLRLEIESVVNSVLHNTKPVSTADDSIYALRVCMSALDSVQRGTAVFI